MAQLTFASIPGFVDLPDSAIAADQALTDDSIQKISHNAKFGAVRYEMIYMGFFKHAATVGTPVSPVDGYVYAQAEVLYSWARYATRAPGAGFVNGQKTPPTQASSQPANLYWELDDINDATGVVSLQTSYFVQGGAETQTNDGIIKVWANCQRSSVNVAS